MIMKRILPKRIPISRFLLLVYFLILTGLGLPLGLLAIKLNVDYHRKAETVTFKAAIPPNPFNTPNYKQLYNKSPEIVAAETIYLSPEESLNVSIEITDPDWIPGLEPISTRFISNRPLPRGLKIMCITLKKTKQCSLVGTPASTLSQPQALTITATDALDKAITKKVFLR